MLIFLSFQTVLDSLVKLLHHGVVINRMVEISFAEWGHDTGLGSTDEHFLEEFEWWEEQNEIMLDQALSCGVKHIVGGLVLYVFDWTGEVGHRLHQVREVRILSH